MNKQQLRFPTQAYRPDTGATPLELRLPRPLWQLEEELAAHLATEKPPYTRYQEWYDWCAKRDGLKMWISYANSKFGNWQSLSGADK